jgi:H+/Cl- antiporter ClcA/CBS domain-containing protein
MKTRGDFAADSRTLILSGMALVIGAVCAVIAIVLLKLIALFTNLFYFHQFSFGPLRPDQSTLGVWAIAVPVVGSLIIGLMARYGSERIRGHGIPEALEAILFGKSIMQPKVAVLKPLSSAISIGSGGPFGAEGPIIMTGGAFGSIIAQLFHLTAGERKTLLVAGAAAGMAATFAAPMASVMLAVELLLFEWKPRSLIPVTVAAVTAAVLRPYLIGSGPLFPVAAHASLPVWGLVAACGVGLVGGIFAAALSNALYKVEDLFLKLPIHWMWWPALGGLAVGIGGWFQPRALGVGYDAIADLLNGNIVGVAAITLIAVKCTIWIIALASGTSGGVLAPLLIMGAGLGAMVSLVLPSMGVGVWPLIAMAAVLGGMMRAPFTAVIFALELTHDYDSILPLLIASVSAYAVTVLIMKRSILTEKVARRGYDLFREYMVDPLERVRIGEVMTADVISIPGSMPVSEMLKTYFGASSKRRAYPVVGMQGEPLGVISGSDLLTLDSLQAGRNPVAADLINARPIVAHPQESCRVAAERMAQHSVGRLLIVDPEQKDRLVGIVTRSDLLKPRLQAYEEEVLPERILGWRIHKSPSVPSTNATPSELPPAGH